MPNFKKNPSAFRMKGYSYPGVSPIKKDVKMYNGNGEEVNVDDSKLGKQYFDENGNKSRDHKNGDVLYTKPPRGPSKWEGAGPEMPRNKPIEQKRNLA